MNLFAEVREEESLNLTAAIWFAWGVLLNSGIGNNKTNRETTEMSSLMEFTKNKNPGFSNDFSNLGLVCGFLSQNLFFLGI